MEKSLIALDFLQVGDVIAVLFASKNNFADKQLVIYEMESNGKVNPASAK